MRHLAIVAARATRRNGRRQRGPGAWRLPLRKVHTADSILEIAHLRNVLETAGIACVSRNDRLAGALGEIPFVECWPELWIVENLFAIKAQELIAAARTAGSGEIGFASGPMTVTAVAERPRDCRRLPSRSYGVRSSRAKTGT